ncbi:MAG: hypothetical protein HQK77_04890 [Desulfobacterales bacterium]|nr:hypothetical protein [Desulfobacterales bacterium]
MKKMMLLCGMGLFFGMVTMSVIAGAAPSCDDMEKFVAALYEAAEYISETRGDFTENPQMEKDMDTVVSVLQTIADQEKDERFTDALKAMTKIWNKETWKGNDVKEFKRAFDATAVALERVYDKHCAD